MSSDLNRTILIGRLVRDPELRYTQSGTSCTSFSIANNKSYTQNGEKKEATSFFNCVAWGKLGELLVQYCKKGYQIGVEGRLQQRSWEDSTGGKRSVVEVVAENLQFFRGQQSDNNSQQQQETAENNNDEQLGFPGNPFADDDVPF